MITCGPAPMLSRLARHLNVAECPNVSLRPKAGWAVWERRGWLKAGRPAGQAKSEHGASCK